MQTDILIFAVIAMILGYYAFQWKGYLGLSLAVAVTAFSYAMLFGWPFGETFKSSRMLARPEPPFRPPEKRRSDYYTPEDFEN